MRLLRKRIREWYLDQYLVTNSDTCRNLDQVCLDLSYPDNRYYDRDSHLLVQESYEEMEKTLHLTYALFIRFYGDYQSQPRAFWANKDAFMNTLSPYGRGFHLGVWQGPRWEDIRRELRLCFNRTIIVREEWVDRFVDKMRLNRLKIITPRAA